MELLFRKYFWVVNLTFLLLAAWLLAKTVNVFVAGRLTPPPALGQQRSSSHSARQAQRARLSPEALSKLTGLELPKPEPEVVEGIDDKPALPDLDSQDPVKTGLRVRLTGTMVANLPEWSMANIEDLTANTTTVYMIGDTIQSAEIIAIERWRVFINNNGRKEYIDNEAGDGSSPLPVASAAKHTAVAANTSAPPSSTVGSGIRALSDDTFEVPKDEITKAMSNLNDIAMQARIVPAFKDGQATGFKLFSIRPNSLYSKIGIQNGDVIRRINGYEINSPDKALEVYSKLKESSRIEIELERGGSPVRKTYNVR
ncbi:MAG TPA: general secretion pathway protein GspC [Myxococcales bacterium]|nr:general secretion pathway protein GspC [Myxococcales bacterium]